MKNNKNKTAVKFKLSGIKEQIPKPSARLICVCGEMIALEIILERIIPIVNSGYFKLNFGFLPMAVIAVFYGPLYCGAAWAMTDLIGALLFPTGTYFPGFTISQFISGLIYGFLLYRIYKSNSKNAGIIARSTLAALIHVILIVFILGTLWLSILFGRGYFYILPLKAIPTLVSLALEAVVLTFASLIMKRNKKSISDFIK